MKFYQSHINPNAVAAVYEEDMNFEHDPDTREYEAWAAMGQSIERIYVKKRTLLAHKEITEEETEESAPGIIETLRIARPDEVRPAKASPRFQCEHGAECQLPEHSQGWLWREAQQEHPSFQVVQVK